MTQMEAISQQLVALQIRLGKVERDDASKIKSLTEENAKLKEKNFQLEAQLAWFKRQVFGCKSEKKKAVDPRQLTIPFEEWQNEAEQIEEQRKQADEEIAQQKKEATQKKDKKHPTRLMTQGLPRREVIEKVEGYDLSKYKLLGYEESETLETEPGKMYVLVHKRPIYGLINGCVLPPKGQPGIIIAPAPVVPIPKGLPGFSLIAEVMLDKFLYYLPYYRQHQKYLHLGIDLPKTTIEGWFKPVAEMLKPLYEVLQTAVLTETDYLQSDGTTIPVVNKETHKALKEYIWTLRAPLLKLICYTYPNEGSRSGKTGKELLGNFKGYLQTDDYNVYESICKEALACHVGCWAHSRRYLEKSEKENEKITAKPMACIQQMYNVEHIADSKNMTPEQRRELRQKMSAPMIDALEGWLIEAAGLPEVQYRPKGLLGNAVSHISKIMSTLRVYLTDGRLEIDNNGVERAQKNIVIGRKNWLFAGNHVAAENTCIIVSLLASCKECGINPREWLMDVMPIMAKYRDEKSITGKYPCNADLRSLLPDKWESKNPPKSNTI